MRKEWDAQQRIKRKERSGEVTSETQATKDLNRIMKQNGLNLSKEQKEERIRKAMSATEGTDSYYSILSGEIHPFAM
jgi:hypothetical protein